MLALVNQSELFLICIAEIGASFEISVSKSSLACPAKGSFSLTKKAKPTIGATPAPAGDNLIFSGEKHLFCIGGSVSVDNQIKATNADLSPMLTIYR